MNKFLQKIAQAIVDHESSDPPVKFLYQYQARILKKIRKFLIHYNDPLINFNLRNIKIKAHLSHELPFILKNHPYYSSNLGRISSYVKYKYNNLNVIDIGANIGDSVAILREYVDSPILCIEGFQPFLELLVENTTQFRNISIAVSYVGDKTEVLPMQLEGTGGTAHLLSTVNMSYYAKSCALPILTLDDLLLTYSDFLDTKLIKIDTDGFDGKIIRGSEGVLQKSKPAIFFEYDPYFLSQQGDDGLSIFRMLQRLGYEGIIIYDNVGKLLLTLPKIDLDRLQEIHTYFSNRNSHLYCDICVFHSEDQDLYDRTRQSELEFFCHAS